MIDIPQFKTPVDEDLYVSMFEDKLAAYTTLMDKVKDAMYGPGFGNYSNLPGTCLQVLEKITSDLINLTSHDYGIIKNKEPEWAHPESSLAKNYSLGDK